MTKGVLEDLLFRRSSLLFPGLRGRMKTGPQETEEEKAGVWKAIGMGGRGASSQSCPGDKPKV